MSLIVRSLVTGIVTAGNQLSIGDVFDTSNPNCKISQKDAIKLVESNCFEPVKLVKSSSKDGKTINEYKYDDELYKALKEAKEIQEQKDEELLLQEQNIKNIKINQQKIEALQHQIDILQPITTSKEDIAKNTKEAIKELDKKSKSVTSKIKSIFTKNQPKKDEK